jgi:hypothetical protein
LKGKRAGSDRKKWSPEARDKVTPIGLS